MYDFIPKGMSTITVVILGVQGGKVVPVSKFTLARSKVDMAQRFALRRDGEPVLGPCVYRERTRKELKAAGLENAEYIDTLVPLCNTGTPSREPVVAAAA